MSIPQFLTPAALRSWVETAAPGDWCVYHIGGFATGDTCRLAMQFNDAGKVTLAQKKHGLGHYEYRARRTVPAGARR